MTAPTARERAEQLYVDLDAYDVDATKGIALIETAILAAEQAARTLAVDRFVQGILHGDADHRMWLLDAARAFKNGREPPMMRGARRRDDMIERLRAVARYARSAGVKWSGELDTALRALEPGDLGPEGKP